MTKEVVSTWATILQVPNSKLFLKDRQLDYVAGQSGFVHFFGSRNIF